MKNPNDFDFHPNTPEVVKRIILAEYGKGHVNRLQFVYGNVQTGEAWGNAKDNYYGSSDSGYIGKSTGTKPIPLAIYNSRSLGGGAILTDCIVAIRDCVGKGLIYNHPNFHDKE